MCADVKDFFALLLYGELSFDEEERVESHLDACADCRTALERQREVQLALDNIGIEPAPSLLRDAARICITRLVEEEAGDIPPPSADGGSSSPTRSRGALRVQDGCGRRAR